MSGYAGEHLLQALAWAKALHKARVWDSPPFGVVSLPYMSGFKALNPYGHRICQ